MKNLQVMGKVLVVILVLLFSFHGSVWGGEEQEVRDFADRFQDLFNAAASEELKTLFADQLLLVWDEISEYDYQVYESSFQEALEMQEEERMEHWDLLLVPEGEVWRMEEVLELIREKGFDDPATKEEFEELIRYGTLWQFAYFATMDESWQSDPVLANTYITQSSLVERGFLVPQAMVFDLLELEDLEPMDDAYDELIVNPVGEDWHVSMLYEDEEWGPYDISFAIRKIDGKWLLVELH